MGSQSGLVPIAIASPGPAVALPSAPAPAKNSNTIIFVIFLIFLGVFCVFLFTKLNTQDKRIKQLESNQESMLKLLPAIAQRVGVRVDEKGEIQMMGEDEDEEENCEDGDQSCQRERMESDSKDHDEKIIFFQGSGGGGVPPVPASVFAKMFAQQATFMGPRGGVVVEEHEKSESEKSESQSQESAQVAAAEAKPDATAEVSKAQDSVDKVN